MFQKGMRKTNATDAHEIVWKAPWAARIILMITGLFILAGAIFFTWLPLKPGDLPFLVILDYIFVGAGLFLIFLSSDTRLRFDLDRRTYSYSDRLLFVFRNVTGTFDDIKGVYIHSSRSQCWWIRIEWKKSSPMKLGMKNPALDSSSSRPDAEARAEKLAGALGVRVVPNPHLS